MNEWIEQSLTKPEDIHYAGLQHQQKCSIGLHTVYIYIQFIPIHNTSSYPVIHNVVNIDLQY